MRHAVPRFFAAGLFFISLLGEGLPQGAHAQKGTLDDPIDLTQIETVDGNMDCDYAVVDCYSYQVALPESDKGYHLAPKNWLAPLDPSVQPDSLDSNQLSPFATPGEYEPATFVIYAQQPLHNVRVSVGDLTTQSRMTIPGDSVQVRVIRRGLKRLTRAAFREEKYHKAIITDRYVPAYEPMNMKAKQFREVWLSIKVPGHAKAGDYTGEVTVQPEGRPASTLDLSLEVLPFELKQDPDKQFGIYYKMFWRFPPGAPPTVEERAAAELRDMRKHGVNMIVLSLGLGIRERDDLLVSGVGVHFSKQTDGSITWSFDNITKFIDLAQQAGYDKLRLVINSGLKRLAQLRGHGSLDRNGPDAMTPDEFADAAEAIEQDDEFYSIAEEALGELKDVQEANPQFELVLSHMDEVFNDGQLPAYLALSKAVRRAEASWPLYMTMRTSLPKENRLRKEVINPYVDIRNYNGASFEQWLVRNDNSVQKHRQELEASGDEAWTYHYEKGYWMNPEANRVITGLYLWNSPLNGRADYTYHFRWLLPVGWNDNLPFHQLDERDVGLAFPSRKDYTTPVPTKNWQAEREGFDDLRYFYTLQQAIRDAGDTQLAQEAKRWLQGLDEEAPIPPDPSDLELPRDEYGAGSGLFGTPEESPISQAAAANHAVDSYQRIRRRAADYTARLMETNTAREKRGEQKHAYAVSQNYPNPFDTATTIHYTLPKAQHARLTVYDALGRQVATLVDEQQRAGRHAVRWRAGDQASGVHFYRLEVGDFTKARPMTLVK